MTVQVVLAVFDPDPEHIAAQIQSLARQTGVAITLHAVIADLASADLVDDLARRAGLDVKIHVPATQLSSVAAFEFGLTEAVRVADGRDVFSLCDQDDIWWGDKLSKSISALQSSPGCHLVHSDARLVDNEGQQIAASMFAQEQRDRRTGLRRLLYRNSITGMTCVFTKEVASHALPFPRQSGVFFYHDLWLGLVAAAKGPIACLRDRTVDYRQHGKNVVGAVGVGDGPKIFSKDWLRTRFASYSLACYLAKSLMLRVEQISATEPKAFDRSRLEKLRPYLRHYGIGLPHFLDAVGYWCRGYGDLANHSFSQGVIKAGRLVWAARKMLRLDFKNRLKEFDDVGFSLAPGMIPQVASSPANAAEVSNGNSQVWYSFLDKRKSRNWDVAVSATRKAVVTILIPTLNPTEIFAGVGTALDLGIGLAQRGMRVRFVATDLPLVCPHATRNFLANRMSAQDRVQTLTRIDLACGVTAKSLAFSPFDNVIATAWWTAHVAKSIIDNPAISADRFFYLIQDYEPNFYAWGVEYAGAVESYSMPCIPIFNTTLLRDFVNGQGFDFDGHSGLAFRPSIDVAHYAELPRVLGRQKRRIAVYGRPEVPRNMFPVCVEALAELVHALNLTPEDVEIVSVGMAHEPIVLPGEVVMRSLGKLAMEDYPVFLTTVDIGLSLMYSPHPSHLPIEMAASGAHVVTNSFGPKDLSKLSPLIRSADPTPGAVARELAGAWAALDETLSPSDRQIDLSALGVNLENVSEALFETMTLSNPSKRVA